MSLVIDRKFLISEESKVSKILEGVYHKGQKHAWNGKRVLHDLLGKHNGIQEIEPEQKRALKNIFSIILWGELAAWKISAQLAAELDNIEAKMAATSQVHDEARHFYVMRDYLSLGDYNNISTQLPKSVEKALAMVLSTDNLAKKLLGMQLMVEPVALTIFQEVRGTNIEPVLCELLSYFEKDEARHIALGVNYLPIILNKMSTYEIISLLVWQIKLFRLEVAGLQELKKDFECLGIDPEHAFLLAEKKQLEALKILAGRIKIGSWVWKPAQLMVHNYRRHMFKDDLNG
ncbi:hypothetical protein CL634_10300 [bacterium]|nr:hypothetical protein [bacterium]